jgi:hypothetical protein
MSAGFGNARGRRGQVDAWRSQPPMGGYPAARLPGSRCERSPSWKCQLTAASFVTAVAGQGGEADG